MKKQLFTALILPLFCTVLLALASLNLGSAAIGWQNWQSDAIFILRSIRIAAAFVVGSSLALAGLVFQANLRNVLAEPFTLGVSSGASVGAALAIIFNLQQITFLAVPAAAFAGALVMVAAVLVLSAGKGVENMLLSGVIAGTCASGILMYIISAADRDELAGVTWWMLGDLQAVDAGLLSASAIMLLCVVIFLQITARKLNALAMGSAMAWSLGVDPRIYNIIFITVGSLLAAQTVALAGLIAFAGLIVPHIIRKIYGSDHRKNILPCALWGGFFLILCDLLSRILHPAHELPIGVLTAAVGGSVFIYLLNKRRSNIL